MDVPDSIERRLEFPHPPERVWRALTEPAEVGSWFGEDCTLLELRPGGRMVQHFRDPSRPELGLMASESVIMEVEPPRKLVWAWRPFPGSESLPVLEGPHTVVTWALEPAGGGTTLTMVESGFAGLPANMAKAQYEDNQGGWDHELGSLAEYLAA